MRWQESAALTAFAGLTIVAASPDDRNVALGGWEDSGGGARATSSAGGSSERGSPRAEGAAAHAPRPDGAAPRRADLLGSVGGRVTLLGRDASATDVVVYLELIALPEPPRPAPRPEARPLAREAPAPRDSVRVVWGALRDLWSAVRDQREVLADIRARLVDPTPRRGAVPPLAPLPNSPFAETAPPEVRQPAPEPPRPDPEPAPAAAPTPAPVQMLMQRKEFRPHVAVVAAGGVVTWPNGDPFSHNVFSNTPGGSFDLGLYPRGESRGAAFRRPGVYEIFCNIHSRMSAFVVSVPSGFWARPSADGRFAIAGVPPGRYRVHAWHERAPQQAQVVTVSGDGAASATLTLDARGYRPARHANKFGQPYPPATRDEY
mgnify:CR=1 FL=1